MKILALFLHAVRLSVPFTRSAVPILLAALMCLAYTATITSVLAANPTPTPTPTKCQVCVPTKKGTHIEYVDCNEVPHYLATHPGSCAGPCPCNITQTQNP